MNFDSNSIEKIIDYSFKNKLLLQSAFTHKSFHGSNVSNNERLEFLGDSILGYVVTEYLYKQGKKITEGQMTSLKQRYVSTKPLANAIRLLGLQDYIIQGESLNYSAGLNDRLLENLFEAIVAALYLDGGLECAVAFIHQNLLNGNKYNENKIQGDYKSSLQIYTQSKKMGTPSYEMMSKSGPEHDPVFTMAVLVGGKTLAVGNGGNKSVASQDAARRALNKLIRQE